MSGSGRLCCKSLKTPGDKFPARSRNKPRSLIDVASGSLPKSPVSLSPGDEVPHMFTRKPRIHLEKFAIDGAKRLLQHNLPQADMAPYSITSLALCALKERKSKNRKDRRPLFPMLRRSRALGDFCGVSAMQAIDAGRPLRGWMLQQRGAVVLQIQRQLHL